jgi:hypothetical protein
LEFDFRLRHKAARESQSIEFTVLWQASFKKLLSSFASRAAYFDQGTGSAAQGALGGP